MTVMWRNTPGTYGLVTIIFHWAVAVLFIGQIALGYLTQLSADYPRQQFDLYQWHKSFGFLVLLLALLRVGWSLANVRPGPVPGSPPWETVAATAAHRLLLVLTILIPLAGWAIASTSPLNIPSVVFNRLLIPDLPLVRSDAAEAFWSSLHAWLAYGAGVLVLLHAGAAAMHHLVRRDRTLVRMLGTAGNRGDCRQSDDKSENDAEA